MIEVNSVAIDGMSIIFVAKLRLMKITIIKKIESESSQAFLQSFKVQEFNS